MGRRVDVAPPVDPGARAEVQAQPRLPAGAEPSRRSSASSTSARRLTGDSLQMIERDWRDVADDRRVVVEPRVRPDVLERGKVPAIVGARRLEALLRVMANDETRLVRELE